MRLSLGIAVLFLLVSCDEIEGRLQVFSNFSLTADNGREVEIVAGTHDAEFSYDIDKLEIELEIKRLDAGSDRDFIFSIPEDMDRMDFNRGRTDIEIAAAESGQDVELSVFIDNTTVSKTGPHEDYMRCRSASVYAYETTVYNLVTRQVDVHVGLSRAAEELAAFTGAREITERQVIYRTGCQEYDPEWGRDPYWD